MAIKVNNLSKKYGDQMALDSISFEVQKGEIVGFLGPNGAGKSTTMKILTGYLSATSGSVNLLEQEVGPSNQSIKGRIGYLAEHNPLYLDMYVKEFLAFVGEVFGIKGNSLKTKINETIELVGLQNEQTKKIGQLSKGYRQRVGLAQALIHNPEILILDEPTTGLDPNQLVEIRQVIKNAGQNKAVLFSSHIMQEVEAICDRVIIINKGKIVANSTLKEIGANGQTLEEVFRELTK